jgi:probable addiction module antidote protein
MLDMSKFSKWDPVDYLHSEEDALLYLQACIDEDDGDGKLILAALSDVARAKNLSALARDASISRDALYKTLSAEGRPGFAVVLRIIRALGLEISLRRREPAETQNG